MSELLVGGFFQKVGFIIVGVILLTFLQQIHFSLLQKLAYKAGWLFHNFVMLLLRVGVIIHEFFHLIFAFLSGHRIEKIQLFKEDGGQVDVRVPDYIGSIAYQNGNFLFYLLMLFLNRLGIFLTGVAPLLGGIFFHWFLFSYGFSVTITLTDFDLIAILLRFGWWSIVIFLYVLIVMPSFLLSWQDLKSVTLYSGKNFISAFLGTLFSLFFVLVFLSILTYFFFPLFVSFGVFYFVSFGFLLIVYFISLFW